MELQVVNNYLGFLPDDVALSCFITFILLTSSLPQHHSFFSFIRFPYEEMTLLTMYLLSS